MHITYQLNTLHNIKPHREQVVFANGNSIYSSYKGDFESFVNNNKILLKNVLYIANFKRNLISISKLIEQNYKITFQQKNKQPFLVMYNSSGKIITYIKENKNSNTFKLWILIFKIKNFQPNQDVNYCHISENIKDRKDIFLWHRRSRHKSTKKQITLYKY